MKNANLISYLNKVDATQLIELLLFMKAIREESKLFFFIDEVTSVKFYEMFGWKNKSNALIMMSSEVILYNLFDLIAEEMFAIMISSFFHPLI